MVIGVNINPKGGLIQEGEHVVVTGVARQPNAQLLQQANLLEFRLKRSDSASLSRAQFAFHNELDEMDRVGKSSQ
jgi:hypothetical protein